MLQAGGAGLRAVLWVLTSPCCVRVDLCPAALLGVTQSCSLLTALLCVGDVETRTSLGEQSAISARLLNQKGSSHPLFPLQVRGAEFTAGLGRWHRRFCDRRGDVEGAAASCPPGSRALSCEAEARTAACSPRTLPRGSVPHVPSPEHRFHLLAPRRCPLCEPLVPQLRGFPFCHPSAARSPSSSAAAILSPWPYRLRARKLILRCAPGCHRPPRLSFQHGAPQLRCGEREGGCEALRRSLL